MSLLFAFLDALFSPLPNNKAVKTLPRNMDMMMFLGKKNVKVAVNNLRIAVAKDVMMKIVRIGDKYV